MARRLPRFDRFTWALIVLASLGVAAGVSATRPPHASARNVSCGWDGRRLVARATIVAGGDAGDFVVTPRVEVAGVGAVARGGRGSVTLPAHGRLAWRARDARVMPRGLGAPITRCAVSVEALPSGERVFPSGD